MYETLAVWQQVVYWFVMSLAVLQLVCAPFVYAEKNGAAMSIFSQMTQGAATIAVLLWLK